MTHRNFVHVANLVAAFVLFVGAAACSSPSDPSNVNFDDTGASDAGITDSGSASDTGTSDAGIPDSGSPDTTPTDAGTDTEADVGEDTGADVGPDAVGDAGADAGTDTGVDTGMDVGPDAVEDIVEDTDPDVVIEPGADPVVTRDGTAGYLLRGDVLAPDGVQLDAEVLVLGDEITCVGDCSGATGAADATVIETNGLISPGLIDAHNHLAYNFLPEWNPPGGRLYQNRYQWADDPSYEEWVLPYTANRSSNSHFCPASQWGELRSLLHGTTTMQGQSFERSCTEGMVRNADHDHGLGDDHMRTTIGSVRDINDDDADGYLMSFADGTTRFAVHMQEGYAENNVLLEFESFAGRDTRPNRHAGVSLLGTTSVLIHSISLTDAQLDEAEAEGSYIVWSPSSNIVLYDQTLDLEAVLSRDIVVGMGPDWTISGEDDMLAEMEYGFDWALDNGVALTSERLWRMATIDGAEVVGLGDRTGRIEEGYAADISIFRSIDADPYRSIIHARALDVTGVFIDGELIYGVDSLSSAVSGCEELDVCGDPRFVCRAPDDTFDTIADIEQELIDILEGTGFPAGQQYGRGDDLLPLVDCDR